MSLEKYKPGVPIIELPDEDWERIEKTLGLEAPNPELRRRVARYVYMNLLGEEANLPQPRHKHYRKWLKKIRDDACRLLGDLELSNGNEEPREEEDRDSILDRWARDNVSDALLPNSERKTFLPILSKLATDADQKLRSFPTDKGGRPPDLNIKNAICDLATAYEIHTGKRPTNTYSEAHGATYDGRFYDFVDAVLGLLAPQCSKSEQGLGMAIRNALKVWRRSRGMG